MPRILSKLPSNLASYNIRLHNRQIDLNIRNYDHIDTNVNHIIIALPQGIKIHAPQVSGNVRMPYNRFVPLNKKIVLLTSICYRSKLSVVGIRLRRGVSQLNLLC